MDDVVADAQGGGRTLNSTHSSVSFTDLFKTGPGTIAGRYLRMLWQPVHAAKDIERGQAKQIRIMSENLTLYRGESGAPHLVASHCPHRGAQLSLGLVEGDDIRCIYHGWKFTGAGQCIEQPAEPAPFCKLVSMKAYPVQQYLGMIFAYMGDGDPPPFPRIEEFEDEEYPHELRYDTWPCNYFLHMENAVDKLHTHFLHWQFGYGTPEQYVAEEAEHGIRLLASGLSTNSGPYDQGFIHMPNVTEFAGAPYAGQRIGFFARGWRVPRDDMTSIRFNYAVMPVRGKEAEALMIGHQERKLRPKSGMESRSVVEYVNALLDGEEDIRTLRANTDSLSRHFLINAQDCMAMAGISRVPVEEYREHLGRTDVGVALLRRLWLQELHALAEGWPLRQWKRPQSLWGDMKAYHEKHA